ncbi:MAG: TIR domain-containing protein, partial [Ktedonobacterales bacterium]|nr:TIR domain-containing protein [Ktedonobacterales bacterium]
MSLPRLFVSHSTLDNAWCRPMVNALTALGYDVWFDEQQLQGGMNWVQNIAQSLQQHDIVIVIMTPASWASAWVQEEINLAIATQKPIIPVRLKPTDVSGFLLTRQWIDAVDQESVPIARKIVGLLNQVAPEQETRVRQSVAAPELVPPFMQALGFVGTRIDGIALVTPPLCKIPGGPAVLGTDHQREPDFTSEARQHTVDVAPFALATYPVTVLEYWYAVAAGAPPPQEWERQSQHPHYPVVSISWKMALAYANWLATVKG